MLDELRAALFPQGEEKTYAIIDGASCEDLLDKLDELAPRYFCLYAGELEPDVEEVAPYLVELLPDHPFSDWLLSEGFGKHWGIFAHASIGLRAVRGHFRTFLLVKSPEGKTVYFRYYDPRVLSTYLPTTNDGERRKVFGPVSAYFCELGSEQFMRYERHGATLAQRECFELSAPTGR